MAIRFSICRFALITGAFIQFCIIQYVNCNILNNNTHGFNAARNSIVSANITCGTPMEQYYNTRQGEVSPRLRQLSICDASNPLYAHPPQHMTDGNDTTFWQSTNNVDKAYITFNFRQPLFLTTVTIKFGDYRRPGQITLYKSTDFGRTYVPWHYMVTDRAECTTVFGIPANEVRPYPDEIDRVICTEYSTLMLEYDETVEIDLNGERRGDGSNFYDSIRLQQWLNVTHLHVEFRDLYRKFDYLDTRWHHYAVKEMDLNAKCNCNGHGNGSVCPFNSLTGLRQCQCHDNTCGAYCDQCCPGYNQLPWRTGNIVSWLPDNTTACQKCNCFGHSDVCVYNSTVAEQRLSLDMHGNYSGGGVCQNCQHNTEGINCHKCSQLHYRPANTDPTSINACLACNCMREGSIELPDRVFLDCIRDSSAALLYPGKLPGDCFCKTRVTGQRCDTCIDGYYRIQADTVDGCLPCACSVIGTTGRSQLCEKDFYGQCQCKVNVKLRDCSQCRDGYYDLRESNPNGCQWCDCDVGGSYSQFTCDKITGQCDCRNFIAGRKCRDVLINYYYPTLHYIFASRDPYSSAKANLTTTLFIPKTASYRIVLAYSLKTQARVNLDLRLQRQLSSTDVFTTRPTLSLLVCSTLCFDIFKVGSVSDFVLTEGSYTVTVNSDLSQSTLQVERIIAIPRDFLTALVLSISERQRFLLTCSVEANDMRIGTADESFCLASVYSITVAFNDGALPCQCNPIGSVGLTCNKYGGQCQCKPGVGERACTRCLPGYYGFSNTGCLDCGCKGPNKICDPVTGTCSCPPNTVGRFCDACQCNDNSNQCLSSGVCLQCQFNTDGDHCERCQLGFYGNALNKTCTACNCNLLGARNASCDQVTGQCFCKPGVIGLRCDACQVNYFGLSSTGCSACNCNHLGSTSLQCDDAGLCLCKQGVVGLKCNQCRNGFYGLPSAECQPCNCNAIGTIQFLTCTNDATGQCPCKTGISGRACDVCARQFVNFTSTGCEQCPLCTRRLQERVDVVSQLLSLSQIDVTQASNLSQLENHLISINSRYQDSLVASVLFEQRLLQGRIDYDYLTNLRFFPLNRRHSELLNRISELETSSVALNPTASSTWDRIKQVEQDARTSYNKSIDARDVTTAVFTELVTLNSRATFVVNDAFYLSRNLTDVNFSSEEFMILRDLNESNALYQNVSIQKQLVDLQQKSAESFTSTVNGANLSFAAWEIEWQQDLPQFLLDLQTVHMKGDAVIKIVNETRGLIQQQHQYINDTRQQHTMVQQLLTETNEIFAIASGMFESNTIHTVPISGDMEINILKYDMLSNILRVQVLQARGLAARDFPTSLADPYVKISLRPDWNGIGYISTPIMQGTLNPKWPTLNVYVFSLPPSQVSRTKLVFQMYDSDPSPTDKDDFMGEVVIDLGTKNQMFTEAVSSFETLRLQNYDQRWGENDFLVGENTLIDLQQLITGQITELINLLSQAEQSASSAENKATLLSAEAQLLADNFAQARRYASSAVNAVNRHREIYMLINSSLAAAYSANNSINEIVTMINAVTLTNLQTKTMTGQQQAASFLAETKRRNITFPACIFYLRSETYDSAGIQNPPRSSIQVDGIEFAPNQNGHIVVVFDYSSGRMENSAVFRTDLDLSQGGELVQFLRQIPVWKIVAVVKQGEGTIASQYEASLIAELIELGGSAPFYYGNRGSFALLGIRRERGQNIDWIRQEAKFPGGGISQVTALIQFTSSIGELVHTANQTFLASLPHWSEISRLFPTLKVRTAQFIATATQAPVIKASLQAIKILLLQANEAATSVLREASSLRGIVDDLTEKYESVVVKANNATVTFNNAARLVGLSEAAVPLQAGNVIRAAGIVNNLTLNGDAVHAKLTEMESKAKLLESLSSNIPLAVMFGFNQSAVYSILGVVGSPSPHFYTSLEMDFKTNDTDGIIIYLLSQPGQLVDSIGLYLKHGRINAVFDLDGTKTTLTSNLFIQRQKWYNLAFARYGERVYLVVRDDLNDYSLAYHDPRNSVAMGTMSLSSSSRIYLSGFRGGEMDDLTAKYGELGGYYDNLKVNGMAYNLLRPESYRGFHQYAAVRYGYRKPSDGTWVSFFGNGYLRHGIGTFLINALYSEARVEFRTFQNNVVLFGVLDQNSDFAYGVYIKDGKVVFQFSTTLGNDVALMTNRANYNNGVWYELHVLRSNTNASLSVSIVGSTSSAAKETVTIYVGTITIPSGSQMIFGAPLSGGTKRALVRGIFAGDMRKLFLSDFLTGQLIARNFNGSFKTTEFGVSYYDMIPDRIVNGLRFYGDIWWEGIGSYAAYEATGITTVTSLLLTFKTKQLDGLLLYSSDNNVYYQQERIRSYMYIALASGNLFISLHGNSAGTITPFMSNNLTLSDGRWHNVSFEFINNNYRLRVDGTEIHNGWFGDFRRAFAVSNPLYFGGLPAGMSLQSFNAPSTKSLEIDVYAFVINNIPQNFFRGTTRGVSHAGVSPGQSAPLPPPSCIATFPELVLSNDRALVRFGEFPWLGQQSWIGFNLNEAQKAFFKTSFVVTLEFKSVMQDGIIFYIADDKTNPTQYISLESYRGRIIYEFKSGSSGHVSISTVNDYSKDGLWHKVYMLRIFQFGALLLPTSKEYHNGRHNGPAREIIIGTPLYIGGLPSDVNAPHFKNRNIGYNGCLRKFEVSSSFATFTVDFSEPHLGGRATGTKACYSNAEPGVHYNMSSWVHYANDFTLNQEFDFQLNFRTNKRSALFFYLFSNETPFGADGDSIISSYMMVEMIDGIIYFYYKPHLNALADVVQWVDPSANNSFLLCDQKWHKLAIKKVGSTVSITVDGLMSSGIVSRSAIIRGSLYIGGIPDNILKPGLTRNCFEGCMSSLRLHDTEFLQTALSGNNVSFGCPTSEDFSSRSHTEI